MEWWIIGGAAFFADGDISDMNHAGYVLDCLANELIGEINTEMDTSFWPDEDIAHVKKKLEMDSEQFEEFVLKQLGYDSKKWDVLTEKVDPRDYGLAELGWKRVHGRSVETYTLLDSDLRDIANGLYDAYGDDVESEPFEIEISANRKLFVDVPWNVIELERVTELLPFLSL